MDLNDFLKTESRWNYVDGKEGAGSGGEEQTVVQYIQRKQNKMKRTEDMYTYS